MAFNPLGSLLNRAFRNELNRMLEELYNDVVSGTNAEKAINEFLNGTSVVTNTMLGPHVVTGPKIANETLTEQKYGNRSVSSRALALRSVTELHLATGAVLEDAIGPHAVNQYKIAPGAVTESKYGDRSVSNRALALRSVNGSNIDYETIKNENILDKGIETEKVNFDALTVNKGMAYPLKNLGDNHYAIFEDAILDIQVLNAKENRVYRPESLLKDWEYNGETFTGVQMQYKEVGGAWRNLILRHSQHNISNGQVGIQTHLISDPAVDESFLVTIDWDAVSTGIVRMGTVEYIIDESKHNYETRVKDNPLKGKNGVAFGDSITQGGSYTDYISNKTGANYINVGFGSTRLARTNRENYPWKDIGMCDLVDAITSGDWSLTDAAIDEIDAYYGNTSYSTIYNRLKSIDFNTVDFITFMYGTNDANNSVFEIGTPDSTDTYTVNGALNYILQTLITTYPHIKVYALSPIFRRKLSGWGDGDSDDSKLPDGVYLYDIAQAIVDKAKEYHVPVKDMYNESGINRYNADHFLKDGVHPGDAGNQLMNEVIYKFLLSY